MKTIRLLATQFVDAQGILLGFFQLAQDLPAGMTAQQFLTNYINAIPQDTFLLMQAGLGPFLPDVAHVVAFVLAVGPVLAVAAPVVVAPAA